MPQTGPGTRVLSFSGHVRGSLQARKGGGGFGGLSFDHIPLATYFLEIWGGMLQKSQTCQAILNICFFASLTQSLQD